jgi:ArsR family transcriptional regulator
MKKCNSDAHKNIVISIKDNMLEENSLQKLCNIYKAIGETSRMKIVLALMENDLCVYHISETTGQKQSLTSHQLSILKNNKIIKSRREGQLIIYSIADEHIKSIIKMSIQHLECL